MGSGSAIGAVAGYFGAKESAETAARATGAGIASQEALTREGIAAQKEQAARAEAFLREQAGQARADLQPFREAQLGAIGQLQGLTQVGSAAENAQRSFATQQIQQQLAAQGLLRSTAQGDQLQNLELGFASQRQGILSQLAGLGGGQAQAGVASGLGQSLGGLYGGLGQQLGSTFGSLGQGSLAGLSQLGQIQGAGVAGAYGAVGAGYRNQSNAAGATFGTIYANQQQQKQNAQQQAYLEKLLGGQGGYSGAGYTGSSSKFRSTGAQP